MPIITPQGQPTSPVDSIKAAAQAAAEQAAPLTKPTEAPKTEEAKPEQADDAATRFAQLARREKMIRQRARDIEAREAALKAKEAELTRPAPQAQDDWKQRFLENPLDVMQEAGMSYDQLLNYMVNQNPLDPQVRALQREIKELREGQTKVLSTIEQQQQNQYQQALKQIKTEVTRMVTANAEDYEAIQAGGESAQDAVVALIEETYKSDGYLMDVAEAAREVEEYLIEQSLAMAKLKKVQAKLTPTQVAAQAEAMAAPTPNAPKANTLSHSMTPQSKPLTAKERRERAMLAFQGKLNT